MIAANPQSPTGSIRQSRRWPAIIVTLLAGHFLLMMTAVFIITRNNHDRLVPEMSPQSVNQSITQAQSDPAGRLP